MSRHNRQNLLTAGLLAALLIAVLSSYLYYLGKRPGQDKDRCTILEGHTFPVQALAFGSDSATLISVACRLRATQTGMEVATWDVGPSNSLRQCIVDPDAPSGLALDPGGRTLAAARLDRSMWLGDTAKGHMWRRLGEHEALVFALTFSRDGGQLATADFEGVVTLWDVRSGQSRLCSKESVSALAFAPDGTALARGVAGGTIRLWDKSTGQERAVLCGHTHHVVALAFSPDGQSLATGDHHGVVKLWDLATLTERATLEASADEGFRDEVSALAFAPHDGILAVAVGRVVQLWDVATGRLTACLTGHGGKVICLAFAPDGARLASGSYDRMVRLWDVTRYRPPPR
jgi:WD40 repeat protein